MMAALSVLYSFLSNLDPIQIIMMKVEADPLDVPETQEEAEIDVHRLCCLHNLHSLQ